MPSVSQLNESVWNLSHNEYITKRRLRKKQNYALACFQCIISDHDWSRSQPINEDVCNCLVQNCSISSLLEMEILQSCTKPLVRNGFFHWQRPSSMAKCRTAVTAVLIHKSYHSPGPCITNVFATRRKNSSQWYRSFLWKLHSHWLKFLRHVAIALVIQGPALSDLNVKQYMENKGFQHKDAIFTAYKFLW